MEIGKIRATDYSYEQLFTIRKYNQSPMHVQNRNIHNFDAWQWF